MPPAWYNSGRGGFKLEKGREIIIAKFFSGKRILKKGETLGFHFKIESEKIPTENWNENWEKN
jgi:hypothetical protein